MDPLSDLLRVVRLDGAFFYAVEACNYIGCTTSPEASITAPALAAPSALTVTGTTATSVALSWTDNAGNEKANTELGQKRADAAKEYLVTRHGIDPGRISTQSKGSGEPAYDNSSAEGKAKNRRAQIVVTLVSAT